MATLILGVASQALGQSLLGTTAFSLFGASISGAAIGGAIGGAIGQFIDNRFLLRAPDVRREGPRLNQISLLASQEGAPIPRVYGRGRVAGQVIWASRFLETATTQTERVGGKGGGGQKVTQTTYAYSVSLAVGLCEGPIAGIGRIWADGALLDAADLTVRVHPGTEDQVADSHIEAIEGAGLAPAYRGLAYVVFEDLPLGDFGNRVPQLQFEVFRPLAGSEAGDLEQLVRAVVLTPGSGEFVYATVPVFRDLGGGRSQGDNMNTSSGRADVLVALDSLEALLPALTSVTLVVVWYGDDLRCASCEVRPGTEFIDKTTYPIAWSVSGTERSSAHLVSRDAEDRPNYGGTPADATVVDLIQELKARGLGVYLCPMVLLDIPPENGLPDPYDPQAADQPAFPWRGRITASLAPGVAGTPDKTAAAEAEIAAFFGAASPGAFVPNPTAKTVAFTGGTDWGYRRFILHYAHLAALAGGVDGFFIGTELRGLTSLRSAANAFPAVTALKTLAGDVRGILGSSAKLSYAADWSEYFGYQPTDGSGDVFFHLNSLWADANIDAIGIDYYVPLSDWRDGAGHADALEGFKGPHQVDYLKSRIESGEGFDWYYASAADRIAQARTAITDGAHGKPWVFRYKDLRSWWSNPHFDRPGGVEAATPTAFVPQSKPIWLAEIGCPAVDKGTNEPNVFFDAKSSESRLPHFSSGTRDDLVQRRALEAVLGYWGEGTNNPVSSVYGEAMVDLGRAAVWTYDARPYPDFPARERVWSDAPNWRLGHWINGRLGTVPLGLLVEALAGPGAAFIDASALSGLVTGYTVDRAMSPRAAIEPLAAAFAFDAVESEGLVRFRDKRDAARIALGWSGLVEGEEASGALEVTRAQESELPAAVRLTYVDLSTEYRLASVEARKLSGAAARIEEIVVPLVMEQPDANAIADGVLQGLWAGRERARFALPPSQLALEPGDIVELSTPERLFPFVLTRLSDGPEREAEARLALDGLLDAPRGPERLFSPPEALSFGRAALHFLSIPDIAGQGEQAGYLAASAAPWPGRVALFKSQGTEGFVLQRLIERPAVTGRLTAPLYAGPLHRFDRGNEVYVEVFSGGLGSVSESALLAGANAAAIRRSDGAWEVLQFQTATLLGSNTYRLEMLLRGQLGTEGAMGAPVETGADFVLLDGAVVPAGLTADEAGLVLTFAYGPAQKPIGDVSYLTTSHQFGRVPLRPLSPVHVRAVREASGDVRITWVRRSRIDADNWDSAEVPLGEATERYEIDVYGSGGTPVRTLSVSTPEAVYGFANQTADFGAPPALLTLGVFQLGEIYGRGQEAKATVHL